MIRMCEGVIVSFDGDIYVKKEDIEGIYKWKTGKELNLSLDVTLLVSGTKAYILNPELKTYTLPPKEKKGEAFFNLYDLMYSFSLEGNKDFNQWFFYDFMCEVFSEFDYAGRIRFSYEIAELAKEEGQ